MTLNEAKELISQFEACKLPKEKWTHEAHFVMALWYCSHQPLPIAIQSIKERSIKRYNISVGGANNDDAGYHERSPFFIQSLSLIIYYRVILVIRLKIN
jgi:hypothetical protein